MIRIKYFQNRKNLVSKIYNYTITPAGISIPYSESDTVSTIAELVETITPAGISILYSESDTVSTIAELVETITPAGINILYSERVR